MSESAKVKSIVSDKSAKADKNKDKPSTSGNLNKSREKTNNKSGSASPKRRRSKSPAERNEQSKRNNRRRSASPKGILRSASPKGTRGRSQSPISDRRSRSPVRPRHSRRDRHTSRSKSGSRDRHRGRHGRNEPPMLRKRRVHNISDTSDDEQSELQLLKNRIRVLESRDTAPDDYEDVHFSYDERDMLVDDFDLRSMAEDESAQARDERPDAQDDFLDILSEGMEGAKKGKPLSSDAMRMVSNFFEKEPDNTLIKEIRERHAEPENCEMLSAKTLNSEIYRNIHQSARKRDFGLKSVQSAMATSAIANLRLIDNITELYRNKSLSRDHANNLLRNACDATKVIAKGFSDLSLYRKVLLRPHVQPKYQALCAKRTYGSALFGDDFTKEIKTIDEESKIMRQFGRSNFRNTRYQMYPKNGQDRWNNYDRWTNQDRGRGPSRAPFRGRRPYRGQRRHAAYQQTAQSLVAQSPATTQ